MKYLFFFMLFITLCFRCRAQDPHFTQYFASPLTLNPALTGFFDGTYRLALNERQQWWNVGSSYSTTSVSADLKIIPDDIPRFDTFGIGFSGLFDKSLSGALLSNYISASAAYHKSLAGEGRQTLGLGFQVSFANRFIDFSKLSFASQFNGDIFDPSIPVSFENNANTKYFEINTGLLYALHTGNGNFYAGASLYHTNKPTETIFDPSGYRIPFRETIHGGGEVNINPLSSMLFSGVFMTQGGINDELIGAAYGMKTGDDFNNLNSTKLYLGFWYRFNDSYIPYIGIDYNNFNVGINYSFSSSSISGYHPATFEVSLIFKHKSNSNQASLCPRF